MLLGRRYFKHSHDAKGGARVKALDRVQYITKDEILKGCQ